MSHHSTQLEINILKICPKNNIQINFIYWVSDAQLRLPYFSPFLSQWGVRKAISFGFGANPTPKCCQNFESAALTPFISLFPIKILSMGSAWSAMTLMNLTAPHEMSMLTWGDLKPMSLQLTWDADKIKNASLQSCELRNYWVATLLISHVCWNSKILSKVGLILLKKCLTDEKKLLSWDFRWGLHLW